MVSSCPEIRPDKIPLPLSVHTRQLNRTFPFDEPPPLATAHPSAESRSSCARAPGSRCPSSIRLCFCSASVPNTSPRCRRSSPYRVFLRRFGMNTPWYFDSHFAWLRPSISSIAKLLRVCFGGSRSGVSAMDSSIGQTSTASPAEPGGSAFVLGNSVWVQTSLPGPNAYHHRGHAVAPSPEPARVSFLILWFAGGQIRTGPIGTAC
jgi:hypothetical protein